MICPAFMIMEPRSWPYEGRSREDSTYYSALDPSIKRSTSLSVHSSPTISPNYQGGVIRSFRAQAHRAYIVLNRALRKQRAQVTYGVDPCE